MVVPLVPGFPLFPLGPDGPLGHSENTGEGGVPTNGPLGLRFPTGRHLDVARKVWVLGVTYLPSGKKRSPAIDAGEEPRV